MVLFTVFYFEEEQNHSTTYFIEITYDEQLSYEKLVKVSFVMMHFKKKVSLRV